ncbi:hypothetical protein BDU57DRAFT_210225 [Ampelomyces quisqualis]|uniref:Uncharacterized protein n=1 Tax=Ampelomyces quisqualis TaxID=50730 RepID=A0A6A5QN38_AMPQU|nr:hypothetical protein BDU57DRAFT_210225 [Ampelomyces quisqualis]
MFKRWQPDEGDRNSTTLRDLQNQLDTLVIKQRNPTILSVFSGSTGLEFDRFSLVTSFSISAPLLIYAPPTGIIAEPRVASPRGRIPPHLQRLQVFVAMPSFDNTMLWLKECRALGEQNYKFSNGLLLMLRTTLNDFEEEMGDSEKSDPKTRRPHIYSRHGRQNSLQNIDGFCEVLLGREPGREVEVFFLRSQPAETVLERLCSQNSSDYYKVDLWP